MWLKNDGEKWSRIFYFEILCAPSEIPAYLPKQFSRSSQILFFHWAAATLKRHVEVVVFKSAIMSLSPQKILFSIEIVISATAIVLFDVQASLPETRHLISAQMAV